MNGGQIKIIGSNNTSEALLPYSSKDFYACANAQITQGLTAPSPTLDDCFARFPGIKAIAGSLGVTTGTLWSGPGTAGSGTYVSSAGITLTDVYLTSSNECLGVVNSPTLGKDWLGCLWASPEASFSCTCPDIGPKFEAYLKLRQNVASFWNTPIDAPVRRAEFLDALQYGPKVEITTSGDFAYKLGMVVYVNVTGVSKNPGKEPKSVVNGKYWISGIKHVITNSGTHESRLMLTQFAIDSPY